MNFLVPIRRLTPSTRGVSTAECRQLKPLSNQIRSLAFTRGLPRQVKGAGLRTLSRRGSWVQIPPPAPFYFCQRRNFQSLKSNPHLSVVNKSIFAITFARSIDRVSRRFL